MSISSPPNSIYLENLSFTTNEQDIYRKFSIFGSIKRIKIFYQKYQNTKYSTGYAFVQFSNNEGKQKCLENGKFVEIKNIIRIYDIKPQTKFNMCAFIFFSDHSITREKINSFFMNYQLSDVTIRSNPTLNHLGFAIIQFQSKTTFEYIFQRTHNSPYQIVFPSTELIELWPTKVSDTRTQVSFNPNIVIDYDKFADFEIIHNSTSYRVNSFLACVYSTRINQLFLTNSISNRIETRIKVDGNFEIIADYLLGKEIKITQDDSQFIFLISADLGIESLLKETYGFVYSSMSLDKAMFIYRELGQIQISIENSPHVRYMAENITKMLSFDDFKTSSTNLISSVLYYLNEHIRSINLTLEQAELLSEWIIGYINQNKADRLKLLQFIIISSIPKIKTISIINDPTFNINLIRRPLLKYLLKNKKLTNLSIDNSLLSISDDSDNSDDDMQDFVNNYKLIRCQDDEDDDDNVNLSSGVFKWLIKRYNANLHDIGIASVSSNSSIHKIIEYHDNAEYWSTTDMQDSWIMFDFKEYEIIPTSYTLKTVTSLNYDGNDSAPSLISWKLEGLNNENKWIILDERRHVNSNCNSNQYRIDQKSRQRWRFIRLSQIGKNNAGTFSMYIQNIEFFGELPRQRKILNYSPGSELDGIFSLLSSELGENPALLNKIDITSSCDPKFLIDETWKGTWKSPNERRSWVKIDLMDAKVDLNSYALKSHSGPGYLRSWIVEVSDDDKKWHCVDKKTFRNDYNTPYRWIKWTCMTPYSNPIRYIKFTMTDMSEERKNIFWLSGIELFGDLIIPK